MITVSELINDPDFSAGSFTVTRKTGTWVNGVFTTSSTTLAPSGTIQPLTSKDIEQLPEGEATKGMISIWSLTQLYSTRLDPSGETGGLSDTVTWQGVDYDIHETRDFSQNGHYKYIGIRVKGA